jgi:hypothetical protein
MAGTETYRKPSHYGRSFLQSEGEWAFNFSMVVVLPLLYRINVIRNIQQVTTCWRQADLQSFRHIFKRQIQSTVWCEAYVV